MADSALQRAAQRLYEEPKGRPVSRPYQPGKWTDQLMADIENELLPKPTDTEDQLMYKLNQLGAANLSAGAVRGATAAAAPGVASAFIGPKGIKRLVEKGRLPMEAVESLIEAKKMHQMSPPPIGDTDAAMNYYQRMWSEFGWNPGVEGTFTTEAPSGILRASRSAFRSPGNAGGEAYLGDLLDPRSPILDAYPGMAKMRVGIDMPTLGETRGRYSPGRLIRIPEVGLDKINLEIPRVDMGVIKKISDEEFANEYVKILAHELQHAIQAREGSIKRPTGAAALFDRSSREISKFLPIKENMEILHGVPVESLSKPGAKASELEDAINFIRYITQAPEVQARNAAEREFAMMKDKRISSVAPHSTEDIPRAYQSLWSALPWGRDPDYRKLMEMK